MKKCLTVLVVMCGMLGCGRTIMRDGVEDTPQTQVDPIVGPSPVDEGSSVVVACLPAGEECGTVKMGNAACCEGTRCIEYTVYDFPRCTVPSSDGESCFKDEQCESSKCEGGRCRGETTTCSEAGISCEVDSECCDGTFCDNIGYSFLICTPKLRNGEFCKDRKECASGLCENNECAPLICAVSGDSCTAHADCCGGFFCDFIGYTFDSGMCRPALQNQSGCNQSRECQSRNCVDYQCAP